MKRLIVTNDFSAAGNLGTARLADFLVSLNGQLVWERSPSDAELTEFFGQRKKRQSKLNWQDHQPQHRLEGIGAVGVGLIELGSRFETIELWMDPRANDQLQLICPLHYLRAHREIASRLSLVQAHVPIGAKGRRRWQPGSCRLLKSLLIIASWRAGRGAPLGQRRRRTGSTCWGRI